MINNALAYGLFNRHVISSQSEISYIIEINVILSNFVNLKSEMFDYFRINNISYDDINLFDSL